MDKKLFDALETCLHGLENGETLEAVLSRFPGLAEELHPMLTASRHARNLDGAAIPDDIRRRGRARLLQHAAQMRKARAPRRTWLYNLRPLAVALMLVVFFLSSTGLVRASSTSIPGDSLYPVKRTWEDVRLIFVLSEEEREGLELEYESERVDEIDELLAKGRRESVSFSGYVTAQTNGQWTVSGILVTIDSQTVLPTEAVAVGSAVTVSGVTAPGGVLQAHRIVLVPAGVPVPTPKPEDENETEDKESDHETESISPSKDDAKKSGGTLSVNEKFKISGIVESINGGTWIVNGQAVNVLGVEITGTPAPGASVTIEGYVDSNGVFVATSVVFENTSDASSTSTNDGSKDSSEDDHDSSDDDDDHPDDD